MKLHTYVSYGAKIIVQQNTKAYVLIKVTAGQFVSALPRVSYRYLQPGPD